MYLGLLSGARGLLSGARGPIASKIMHGSWPAIMDSDHGSWARDQETPFNAQGLTIKDTVRVESRGSRVEFRVRIIISVQVGSERVLFRRSKGSGKAFVQGSG